MQLYHWCDVRSELSVCVLPYNVHQFGDFFLSFLSIWTTILMVAEVNLRVLRLRCHRELHFFLHVVGMMLIAFGTELDRFSLFMFVVPLICGLFIVAVSWTGHCVHTRHCFPPPREWLLRLVPGTLCFLIAFSLFGLFETDTNYYLVHSAWHLLVGSALFLLLPFRSNRGAQQGSPGDSHVSPHERELLDPACRPEDDTRAGTASSSSATPSSAGTSASGLPAPSSTFDGKCNYCLVDADYGDDALAVLDETTAPGRAHEPAATRVNLLGRQSSSSLEESALASHRTLHVSSVSLVASPSAAPASNPICPRRAISALLGAMRGSRPAQHHVVHDSDPLVLDQLDRDHSNH